MVNSFYIETIIVSVKRQLLPFQNKFVLFFHLLLGSSTFNFMGLDDENLINLHQRKKKSLPSSFRKSEGP